MWTIYRFSKNGRELFRGRTGNRRCVVYYTYSIILSDRQKLHWQQRGIHLQLFKGRTWIGRVWLRSCSDFTAVQLLKSSFQRWWGVQCSVTSGQLFRKKEIFASTLSLRGRRDEGVFFFLIKEGNVLKIINMFVIIHCKKNILEGVFFLMK